MQTPDPGDRRPRFTEGTMGRNWGVLNRRKAPFDPLLKYHLGGAVHKMGWTAPERVREVGQDVTTMTRLSDGSSLS